MMGFETMRTQMDSSKDEHLQIKISSGNESSPNKRSRAQLNYRANRGGMAIGIRFHHKRASLPSDSKTWRMQVIWASCVWALVQ